LLLLDELPPFNPLRSDHPSPLLLRWFGDREGCGTSTTAFSAAYPAFHLPWFQSSWFVALDLLFGTTSGYAAATALGRRPLAHHQEIPDILLQTRTQTKQTGLA
jgi:hypothetical protein